jgi:hypothetical protein
LRSEDEAILKNREKDGNIRKKSLSYCGESFAGEFYERIWNIPLCFLSTAQQFHITMAITVVACTAQNGKTSEVVS